MLRFSAKTVVVLAALCFMGLVALQIAWIRSAWQGELALYNRAKKQVEAELQSELAQNAEIRTGLKALLDQYNSDQSLDKDQVAWFHFNLVQAIDLSPIKPKFGVYTNGISIVQHRHTAPAKPGVVTVITNIYEHPDSSLVKNAGKLCVHCILGSTKDLPGRYDYQILLFYKSPVPAIFEKLAFLILTSLFLLVVLGFLFLSISKRYRQEKKLSEAKNDFINNLSHEMQTPVFAIQMANRLIKEKTTGQSEISPLTTIVEKETAQLKQHAAKILELASLENEQVELQTEKLDLNSFVEEKLPTLQLMLENKGGRVQFYHHAAPLYTPVDKVHLNNVLVSLVDNAIKYNRQEPEVFIETGVKGDSVYLAVKDNGIGIEPQYLPYIFDKFYRVPFEGRNGTAGFGLGLSYVKQIVNMHKGEIKIDSQPGKGTSVFIFLPRS